MEMRLNWTILILALSILVSSYILWFSNTKLFILYILYLTFVGGVVWALFTELFYKYKNTPIYLIFVILIITSVLILITNITFSQESSDYKLYSFIIAGIFTTITIWSTFNAIQMSNIYLKEIAVYNEKLKIDPKNPKLLNNKGTALADLREYHDAIEYFDKVIEIDPNDAAAWHNKGVVLDKLRKHQEALKYYDKALILDPRFEIAKKADRIILEN